MKLFNNEHHLTLFVFLGFLVFLILPLCVFAQQSRNRIIILNFITDDDNPLTLQDAAAMRDIVQDAVALHTKGELFYNIETDKFLKDYDINLRQIFASDNLGKFRSADIKYVVSGILNTFPAEKKYRLRLSLMRADTGEFVLDQTETMKIDGKAVSSATKNMANKFVGKINFGYYFDYTDPAEYNIGDVGPGGGIIFFVKSRYTDGWRYLEASPKELEFKAAWGYYKDGYYGPDGSITNAALGDGYRNTNYLVSRLFGQLGEGNASVFCQMISNKNHNDWYLPSKDELYYMYINLVKNGLGRFSSAPYWSSTQSTDSSAWFQNLGDGKQYYNGLKTDILLVRAIRQF
ncbi:MAG: hypothetical protein Ta2F_02220 [Termitinemataceae bacterium]|nr:MAG: hypothetical protein Ta2F_02220 [Termitinemataceae bacterium]